MKVMRAEPRDLNSVLDILLEAGAWLKLKGIDQWPGGPGLRERVSEYVEKGEGHLAILGEEIVGTFHLGWSDEMIWGKVSDDAGYIHRLAIRRVLVGRTLGFQLLRIIERMIAAEGKKYARLDCWAENPFLDTYYRNAGYVFCGMMEHHGWKLNRYEKLLDFHRAI